MVAKKTTDPMYALAMDSLELMDKSLNQAQKNTNDFNLGMAKVNQTTMNQDRAAYNARYKNEVDNSNKFLEIAKDLNLTNAQIAQMIKANTKGMDVTPDGKIYNEGLANTYTQADLNNQSLNLNMKDNVFDPSLTSKQSHQGIIEIINDPSINKGSSHYKNNIKPVLEAKEESIVFNEFKSLSVKTLEGLVGSNPVPGFNLDFHVKSLAQSTSIDRSEEIMDKAVTEYYDLFEDAQEAATAQLNFFRSKEGLQQLQDWEDLLDSAATNRAKDIASGGITMVANMYADSPQMAAVIPAFRITPQNDLNVENDQQEMFDFGGIKKDDDNIGFNSLTFNAEGKLIPDPRNNVSSTDVRRLMQYFEGPGKAKWKEIQEVLRQNGLVK
tara:strand:+ start:1633 stop:2781 length:1149 start_codon:yes stop_codon:yes gene_type:complete